MKLNNSEELVTEYYYVATGCLPYNKGRVVSWWIPFTQYKNV